MVFLSWSTTGHLVDWDQPGIVGFSFQETCFPGQSCFNILHTKSCLQNYHKNSLIFFSGQYRGCLFVLYFVNQKIYKNIWGFPGLYCAQCSGRQWEIKNVHLTQISTCFLVNFMKSGCMPAYKIHKTVKKIDYLFIILSILLGSNVRNHLKGI